MKNVFSIVSVLALGGLLACGAKQEGGGGGDAQKPTDVFAYSIDLGGCKAEGSYGTFEAMCQALKSDAKNNNCAVSEREMMFKQSKCAGVWERLP